MNPIEQAIVLDEAKRYANTQRLGWSERTYGTIYFDGVLTGKLCIPAADMLGNPYHASHVFVRISNLPSSPSQIESITIDNTTYSRSTLRVEEIDGLTCFYVAVGVLTDYAYVVSISTGDHTVDGTYVLATDYEIYVSRIDGYVAETIHPIDRKFIPGAVLPVVELSTVPVSGSQTKLTAEESAQMEEVLAMGVPFVGKLNVDEGVPAIGVFNTLSYSGTQQYVCGDLGTVIAKANGVWFIISIAE